MNNWLPPLPNWKKRLATIKTSHLIKYFPLDFFIHRIALLFFFCAGNFLFFSQNLHAQYADEYAPKVTRILFILDASGSMKEKMDESDRFEISKKILVNYLDSLSRNKIKVETALRIFGHQSLHSAKNCQDTKLELPFGTHAAASVKAKLETVKPQGWTPISYTLQQGANDFPNDPSAKNAIVLITDGLETCGGDPCAVAKYFEEKRIALKPFIIGLGLPVDQHKSFECVGHYHDAVTTVDFEKAMSTVITQALNPTTVQINLLNEFGKPTESNVEVSLYDNTSGKLYYNFVHSLNEKGFPDTLRLDPAGSYEVVVHSFPPVTKKGIELIAGAHNIIAVDVPQGGLKLIETGFYKREVPLQCVIRQKGKNKILIVQDFNTERKYLTGTYDLEILTLPRRRMPDVKITQGVTKEIKVESPGTLITTATVTGIGRIYMENEEELERVYEFKKMGFKETLLLQPGKYLLMYRLNDKKSSGFTRTQNFQISSGITTNLRM